MIAREAKLSATTVSLVLNNRADAVGIRPETQERVWAIARRLNYTPNPLAVGLSGGRTNTIGLIWSLGGPQAAAETTRDIAGRMQKRGYLTHLADHGDDLKVTTKLLADYIRRRVDGIVLQSNSRLLEDGTILRQLKEFPASLMVTGFQPADDMEIDYLFHDRLPAFVEAATHLARSGRRRPAMLGMWPSTQSKAAAFFGQAARLGMKIQPDAEIDVSLQPKNDSIVARSHDALAKRFDGQDFPFDALMCTSDELAVVAMDYLRRRGFRIPEDVAVIGFNDSLLAPYQFPPLASADRKDSRVAATIEEMIVNRLEHRETPPQRQTIAMQFVWRESAGAVSTGAKG